MVTGAPLLLATTPLTCCMRLPLVVRVRPNLVEPPEPDNPECLDPSATSRRVQTLGTIQSYASTRSTGIEESAGRSRWLGVRPRATISEPRAATMAPLSVQSPGRGTRTRIPAEAARDS